MGQYTGFTVNETGKIIQHGASASKSRLTTTMSALRILIVGSGGREHALAWKLAMSPSVETVYIAPGNGGTASSGKLQNVAIGPEDFKSLVEFAVKNDVILPLDGCPMPFDLIRMSRSDWYCLDQSNHS